MDRETDDVEIKIRDALTESPGQLGTGQRCSGLNGPRRAQGTAAAQYSAT